MIEIVYNRKFHHVKVKGHAGSDEPGKDLVCAAASMLAMTLAADVEGMTGCLHGAPVVKLHKGDAEIRCIPKSSMRSTVTIIFDSICAGFDILAKNNPDFVRYEVRG